MVDFIFLIDIVIKFRTTFLDSKQSIEVTDPHIIGARYLKGTFFEGGGWTADKARYEGIFNPAADWVSKPVLGREGHGLLYGDEAQAGGAPQRQRGPGTKC